MVTIFELQSKRNKLIFFCCLCAGSLLLFISHPMKYEYPGRELQTLLYVDVLNRLQTLEVRVDSIHRRLGGNIHQKEVATFDAIPVKANFNSSQASSFWTGIDDVDSYEDLFSNRSKEHETCLVTQTKCKHELTFLILITTHISHFERREAIRNTWGLDPRSRWRTAFLVGRSHNSYDLQVLKNELAIYKDIILGDVYEDFYNLTAKVLMGFEWSIRYCKFKYLLKGDDDVFINFPRLFQFINDAEVPKEELYAGNVQYEAKVFRSGRYGISKEDFRRNRYPRYCSGGGFVMSRDVVKAMLLKFPSVKPISIDDAYIGQLALKSGIDVHHNDDFKMFEDEKACEYRRQTIVHHPVKSAECMSKLFNNSLRDK